MNDAVLRATARGRYTPAGFGRRCKSACFAGEDRTALHVSNDSAAGENLGVVDLGVVAECVLLLAEP
jgi:hypothetical protein